MVELNNDRPLKRGLPGTPFYVELYGDRVVVKAHGSKSDGVAIYWSGNLVSLKPPISAPAKFNNAMEYLRWLAGKVERRKDERKRAKSNS